MPCPGSGATVTDASAGARRCLNRVECHYPTCPACEAYVNDEAGLGQEITLLSPLQSGQSVLDLSLSGGLVPSLKRAAPGVVAADGEVVELSAASGAPVLHYTLLSVTGAQGQPLAAHLELAGGQLRLVVDGEQPAYPLTITARLRSALTPSGAEQAALSPDSGVLGIGSRAVAAATPKGLSTISNWMAEGNQNTAYFGISVSTAGDVNGDGYADVIVGAYRYDNGQTDEGRAYVCTRARRGCRRPPAGRRGQSERCLLWLLGWLRGRERRRLCRPHRRGSLLRQWPVNEGAALFVRLGDRPGANGTC